VRSFTLHLGDVALTTTHPSYFRPLQQRLSQRHASTWDPDSLNKRRPNAPARAEPMKVLVGVRATRADFDWAQRDETSSLPVLVRVCRAHGPTDRDRLGSTRCVSTI
jgi:hypothetical protein